MATEVIMPQMGFDMTQGTLVRWLKVEGEKVARGDAIAEIETEKAIVSVEAFTGGVMGRLVAAEGDLIPVGQVIAYITEPGEEPPPKAAPRQVDADVSPAPSIESPVLPKAVRRETLASPRARRLAAQEGLDLSLVTGSGPGGRIVEDDVRHILEQTDTAPATPQAMITTLIESGAIPLSPMRQAIARRMAQSKREIPHFYVTTEIDMGTVQEWRSNWNQNHPETHITLTDLVAYAVVQSLKERPQLNVSFSDEGIIAHPQINLGLAIALEEGLVAPALLDCVDKSLQELAQMSRDLVDRAKAGVLRAEEYTDATFTVTNLGMFDVDSFTAIINPPQAAILALGSVRRVPVVRGENMVIAEGMKATLSCDHRVTDGAQAAQFLMDIKDQLENPQFGK